MKSRNTAQREVIHLNALPPEPAHRGTDDFLLTGKFERDLPELFGDRGAPDLGREIKFLPHLSDDRALNLSRWIGQPKMLDCLGHSCIRVDSK